MYTLIGLLFLAGFYLCYRTSKTVKTPSAAPLLQRRMAANPQGFRWAAALVFFAGWTLLVITMGWGAGSFAMLAYAMCAGSLVVLLAPFGFVRRRQLLILAAVSLLLEFLIRS